MAVGRREAAEDFAQDDMFNPRRNFALLKPRVLHREEEEGVCQRYSNASYYKPPCIWVVVVVVVVQLFFRRLTLRFTVDGSSIYRRLLDKDS